MVQIITDMNTMCPIDRERNVSRTDRLIEFTNQIVGAKKKGN